MILAVCAPVSLHRVLVPGWARRPCMKQRRTFAQRYRRLVARGRSGAEGAQVEVFHAVEDHRRAGIRFAPDGNGRCPGRGSPHGGKRGRRRAGRRTYRRPDTCFSNSGTSFRASAAEPPPFAVMRMFCRVIRRTGNRGCR